ncbi:MAG: hypothetical protein ACLRM6_00765 [Christensenellales bacterium]
MNIIARAALYLYDGSNAAPIFPGKVGKPGDEAAAYLSTVADKLMASDGSRTTCVEPGSAQEEMLRRFVLTPFQEAADALMRSMDETMQTLEIPREGFDMAIFSFEKDGNPHLCVAQLPYRSAMVHQLDVAEDGTTSTQVIPYGTVLPLPGSKGCSGFVVNLSTGDIRLRDAQVLTNVGNARCSLRRFSRWRRRNRPRKPCRPSRRRLPRPRPWRWIRRC